MKIPSLVLKQLYTHGSLENTPEGVAFGLKNRLSDAVVTTIESVAIDGDPVQLDSLQFALGDSVISPSAVSAESPIDFPLAKVMTVMWKGKNLEVGKHKISICFNSTPFGRLAFSVEDSIRETKEKRIKVPYDREDDYGGEIIGRRQDFARSRAGLDFEQVAKDSLASQGFNGRISFTYLALSSSIEISVFGSQTSSPQEFNCTLSARWRWRL